MNSTVRAMTPQDKNAVFEMMRNFYSSPAVYTNGSDEIFLNDIENCINDNPYLEGYIFEDANCIKGYDRKKLFHRIRQAVYMDRGSVYQRRIQRVRTRKSIY